nr:alpha/beta fold hydrolase [uncultured Allomuricauda sp.]
MNKYYFSCFFFLFLNFGIAQDAIKKTLSPDILFKKSKQSSFSISPNGKYFMELLKNNVANDVVVVDIDNYELLYTIPLGSKHVNDLIWLNDKRISYSSRGEIYAMDIDGTNKIKLVNYRTNRTYVSYYNFKKNFRFSKIFKEFKLDNDEILIESFDMKGYSKIKRVNIFTGVEKTIIEGANHKMNRWVVDKAGVPIIGVKIYDWGSEFYVENVTKKQWVPLEVNISGERHWLKKSAETFFNQNLTFVGNDFDKDLIYVTSNINSDRRKLLKYNYVKGQVVDTVIVDQNCDVGNPEGTEIRILYDDKNKELGGVRYEGVTPNFVPFSKDFKNVYEGLRKKFKHYFNEILDADAENNRFVIYQWSDSYAGNIGVYDFENDSYSIMVYFNEELDEYKLSKSKTIGIRNREGKMIPSYFNLPPGYTNDNESKPLPLVVIPHGGPFSRDYWELHPYAQYFSYMGYAVLRVNFQGSVGFGKEHVYAGVEAINTTMIDDIIDAENYISEHYNIDAKKKYIFGHSYGGYATYLSLIRYPDAFAAGVAIAAPTDLKSLLKTQKKENYMYAHEFWKTALGNRGKSYYEEISPINYADKINKPIMVFHGREDIVVPVEHTERMKTEFEKLGRKDKFTIIESQGHSIENSNSIGYILEQSDKFFKKL